MKTFCMSLAAACLFFAPSVFAEPMESDAMIFRLIFKEVREQSVLDVKARTELADAILGFWKDFDSKIPRNSPAVAEWLKKEQSTTDTQRIGRVTATPEYALQELTTLADGCRSDALLLTQSVGKQTVVEMYAWLRIVGCYGNPYATEQHLKTASLSKGLYDGPVTMAHATLLHNFITGQIANALVQQP
ncbi:hypothetical protein FY148_10675 [Agrobacterium tumefaciens]|uniref:hypothetical protein n=1 Tax=Agrobacterium tumefaciens TaxID=358 RepID=UPI0021CF1D5B|nr:hypothetical protein [Agrobacterium tumefaciens]UXS53082.1 hypothetical protein FY148_10675 [Agrobacterium tumefaciens]UXS63326.1 hypothetical protein FY147_10675 [Agrobacterium tumefaciens]